MGNSTLLTMTSLKIFVTGTLDIFLRINAMPQNFLEIENVTFAASDKSKVNNVSLNIENEGDIVCLLGPSGIGKTTILRTIAGLEKIQSGRISLKNKIISSILRCLS